MAKKIDLNGLDHFKEKENAMIASEYSSSKTYAVGDYVYYAGTLYCCTTAITTAENWTAGHWTVAKLADDCSALKTAIMQITPELENIGDMALEGFTTDYITDSVPYSFRTSGNKDTGGNIEVDKLVGGTVVWNQLVPYGNFSATTGYTASGGTFAVSGNVGTFTGASSDGNKLLTKTLSATIPNGHKMLLVFDYISNLAFNVQSVFTTHALSSANEFTSWAAIGSKTSGRDSLLFYNYDSGNAGWTLQLKNLRLFDLTQMFGSTIADYINTLETATAGAGVAYFRSLFPNSYYAYNAGTLMSVNAASHEMVGFNQWDEQTAYGYWNVDGGAWVAGTSSGSWMGSKNYIPCLPNTNYYHKIQDIGSTSLGAILFYDGNKNYIGNVTGAANIKNVVFTTPANAHYMTFYHNKAYFDYPIGINISDPAKNGTYEPYTKHTYPLDSTLTLRGVPKLDSNNKLYYDGDTYASDGTVTRKYVDVTITSSMVSTVGTASTGIKYAMIVNLPYNGKDNDNIVSAKYLPHSGSAASESGFVRCDGGNLYIYDNAFTDLATAKSLLDGMHFVYELATPTTESASPYTNPQICDGSGTEEYVDAGVLAEERDVSIPVGHETKYQVSASAQVQAANAIIAPVLDSMVADTALVANDFRIVDNTLYRITTSVASGATLTPNTNCVATTIAEILKSLLS